MEGGGRWTLPHLLNSMVAAVLRCCTPDVGYIPTPEHLKGKCVGAGRERGWIHHVHDCLGHAERVQVCAIEHGQSSRSVGGGIGDCFLRLGWIATWSEPGPALVIGAIEEEPFDIWPVAQLLGCAHAEQEGCWRH